jgi:hypothetical protein
MDKASLFLAAMNAGLYKQKVWIIRAFSLTRESPDAYLDDPYPYRIVSLPNGYHYVSPNDPKLLVRIPDALIGTPLYKFKEVIHLPAGVVPTVNEPLDTLYGNVFVNYATVLDPLKGKIAFQVGSITATGMEKLILPRLVDDEKVLASKETDPLKQLISVSERVDQANAMFYLTGFTQISTPSATEKSMVAAPGILELRNKLLLENKDHLDDPAVIAKISAELVKFDKAYLAGDRSSDFLIDTGKSFNVVRAKRFAMIGGQKGLATTMDFDVVQNSLDEGWDLSAFATMNNTARAGSYDRGAETQLGGESVKWLLRASSNINILINTDCGTKLGMPQLITLDKHNTIGFSVVTERGAVELTHENYGEYLGKRVMVRSPMFCQSRLTDFCGVCMGPRLSASPTGASNAIAHYGNTFMALSLKSMHGKALKVVDMNLDDILS